MQRWAEGMRVGGATTRRAQAWCVVAAAGGGCCCWMEGRWPALRAVPLPLGKIAMPPLVQLTCAVCALMKRHALSSTADPSTKEAAFSLRSRPRPTLPPPCKACLPTAAARRAAAMAGGAAEAAGGAAAAAAVGGEAAADVDA